MTGVSMFGPLRLTLRGMDRCVHRDGISRLLQAANKADDARRPPIN